MAGCLGTRRSKKGPNQHWKRVSQNVKLWREWKCMIVIYNSEKKKWSHSAQVPPIPEECCKYKLTPDSTRWTTHNLGGWPPENKTHQLWQLPQRNFLQKAARKGTKETGGETTEQTVKRHPEASLSVRLRCTKAFSLYHQIPTSQRGSSQRVSCGLWCAVTHLGQKTELLQDTIRLPNCGSSPVVVPARTATQFPARGEFVLVSVRQGLLPSPGWLRVQLCLTLLDAGL